jgi:hypothetical protein
VDGVAVPLPGKIGERNYQRRAVGKQSVAARLLSGDAPFGQYSEVVRL